MFWMSAYFSVGAWSGMLMMFAPQLTTTNTKVGDGSNAVRLLGAEAIAVNSCVSGDGISLV